MEELQRTWSNSGKGWFSMLVWNPSADLALHVTSEFRSTPSPRFYFRIQPYSLFPSNILAVQKNITHIPSTRLWPPFLQLHLESSNFQNLADKSFCNAGHWWHCGKKQRPQWKPPGNSIEAHVATWCRPTTLVSEGVPGGKSLENVDGVCGLTVGDGPVAHQAHEETEDTSFSKHENGNKAKQQINRCIHSVISDYLSNSVHCFQRATNGRFQTDQKSQC